MCLKSKIDDCAELSKLWVKRVSVSIKKQHNKKLSYPHNISNILVTNIKKSKNINNIFKEDIAWSRKLVIFFIVLEMSYLIWYWPITYPQGIIIPLFVTFFISMVLLRIPTAVQPMTGIKGFKYQVSDG